MSNQTTTGERIRTARESAGLSQKKLANLAGITQSTLSKIERDIGDAKLSTVVKIVDVLSARMDIIRGGKATAPTGQKLPISPENATAINILASTVAAADTDTVEGRGHVVRACKDLYATMESVVNEADVWLRFDSFLKQAYKRLTAGNFSNPAAADARKAAFAKTVMQFCEFFG